jgi:zona occludens toxin
MIYLITGNPGSGKSLFAVSTLIKRLMVDKVKLKSGVSVSRRLCVDGIADLLLDHFQMAPSVKDLGGGDVAPLELLQDGTVVMPEGGHGFGNWYEWALPGDVIVVDEVQRICRPRALGKSPPKMVTALETHRHKGVDIVILTQNPMLLDQNVRRLVNRHIHVRRLFGMARALLYEWDGCQSDVNRVGSAVSRSLWAYPKDAYKLYRSAEAHTKQRQRIPAWMAIPVLALAGGVVVAPMAYAVLRDAMTGKGIVHTAGASSGPARAAAGQGTDSPKAPASAPAPSASTAQAAPPAGAASAPESPFLAGCSVFRGECRCHDQYGMRFEVEPKICAGWTDFGPVKTQLSSSSPLPTDAPPSLSAVLASRVSHDHAADLEVMAFMARSRK